jgi:hypothetical protein
LYIIAQRARASRLQLMAALTFTETPRTDATLGTE